MTSPNTVGLPSSAVVDRNSNLTPEWLNALANIETLHTLKKQQQALSAIDLTDIADAVTAMEAGLTELFATVRPNVAVFVETPLVDAPGFVINHDLGTDDYFAINVEAASLLYNFINNGTTDGGFNLPIKAPDRWSTNQGSFTNSFFTVTFEGT